MVSALPRRRPRGPQHRFGPRGRWSEELLFLVMVAAGLLLLAFGTKTFHQRAAERSDALQQLRDAKQGRRAGSAGSTHVGLDLGTLGGRRWGVQASTGSGDDVGDATTASGIGGSEGMAVKPQHLQQGQREQHSSAATQRASDEGGEFVTGSHGGQGLGAVGGDAAGAGLSSGDATNQEQRQGQQMAADAAGAAQSNSAAELQRFCEEHFGLEWVQRWGAAAQQVCSAARQLPRGGNGGGGGGGSGGGSVWGQGASSVTCRSMNDTHMPAASAPHVICDAIDLRLDPSQLRRARCPVHRPGYLCVMPTYHRYQRGAWAVDCAWPAFNLSAFSKDHQQDIFGSMVFQPELGASTRSNEGSSGDDSSSRGRSSGDGGTMGSSNGGDGAAEGLAAPAAVEELPTLFVTREINEHANVYHTFTDLLNVYITLRVLGWERQPRQVILLDAHKPAALDILWLVAAAGGGTPALQEARRVQAQGGHPWDVKMPVAGGSGSSDGGKDGGPARVLVRRVEDLHGPVMFRHAAFVPPGYTSLLFADLYSDAACPLPTTLFAGFRRFLLSAFGLEAAAEDASSTGSAAGAAAEGELGNGSAAAAGGEESSGGGTLDGGSIPAAAITIRLITRRPVRGKRNMPRQIGNEEELLGTLRTLGGGAGGVAVSASLIDFAGMPVDEQFAVVQQTDILVGMHGAALAHALLLPRHAALVELWTQADGIWRCYEHFAHWAGALYRRVANTDPSRHVDTPHGDVTMVDAAQLRSAVRELLPLVAARRRHAAAHAAQRAVDRPQQDDVQEL